MKLKCSECDVYGVKNGKDKSWICPECHQEIEEPTEETCTAVLEGIISPKEFVLHDSCQDCTYFQCPMQAVGAYEQWQKDELGMMFSDEEAQENFWES